MKLRDLAKEASYDRVCLSKLEWGEQNITYKISVKLARTLDVPYPALFSRNFISVQEEKESGYPNHFKNDDFLSVFIENFRKSMLRERKEQKQVYIEGGVTAEAVSRIVRGTEKNPTVKTLYAMAFTSNSELADLFSRLQKREGLF